MKSIILFGLIVGLCVFYVPQTYAQTNTSKSVQSAGIDNLISILSNAPINVSPEQLQQDLVAAIKIICKNNIKNQLDKTLPRGNCSNAQVDQMITAVIAAFGVDSPMVATLLAALSAYGIDSDTITLAAINAGIDATIASQATAAGPIQAQPNPPISLPVLPTPPGSGGTGGDAGISEVGN
ncbi:hypothetical protein [Pseudoalteromonas sp. SR45-4]|uniref:hypothetical protein n=1 Tax=Pseudoalteromonas sp. SR45-4 TaxID=2760929 RepID=UPI0015FBBC44|nr:hypothetical protein [Pseudoalteromonas sp. SR45-4]MBB1372089.1 hypothetical protein [Pseudoalteromonas sp. SR45-4]